MNNKKGIIYNMDKNKEYTKSTKIILEGRYMVYETVWIFERSVTYII